MVFVNDEGTVRRVDSIHVDNPATLPVTTVSFSEINSSSGVAEVVFISGVVDTLTFLNTILGGTFELNGVTRTLSNESWSATNLAPTLTEYRVEFTPIDNITATLPMPFDITARYMPITPAKAFINDNGTVREIYDYGRTAEQELTVSNTLTTSSSPPSTSETITFDASGNTGTDPNYASWRYTLTESTFPTFNGTDIEGTVSGTFAPVDASGNITQAFPTNGGRPGINRRDKTNFLRSLGNYLKIFDPVGLTTGDVDRFNKFLFIDEANNTITVTSTTPRTLSATEQTRLTSTVRLPMDGINVTCSVQILSNGNGVLNADEEVATLSTSQIDSFNYGILRLVNPNGRVRLEITGPDDLTSGYARAICDVSSNTVTDLTEFYDSTATSNTDKLGGYIAAGTGGDVDTASSVALVSNPEVSRTQYLSILDRELGGIVIWLRRRDLRIYTNAGQDITVRVVFVADDGTRTILGTVTDMNADPVIAVPTPSLVTIQIPDESITEVLELEYGLTSPTAIASDIVTKWNSNTTLASEYTASVSGGTVTLTHTTVGLNAPTVCITEIDRQGDITLNNVMVTDGSTGTPVVLPVLEVFNGAGSFTMVIPGEGLTNAQVVSMLATELSNNRWITAISGNTISLTGDDIGFRIAVQIRVLTAGDDNWENDDFTVAVSEDGRSYVEH